jgi:2-iminobutanoate/2-iminopropanoate deaminase
MNLKNDPHTATERQDLLFPGLPPPYPPLQQERGLTHPYDRKGVTMSRIVIASSKLAPPAGPYSQAIEAGGFLYLSGQVGLDPATGKLVGGGVAAETERVFTNLAAVLKAAGKTFDDVVRVGVFLTKMDDFSMMNGLYAQRFSAPFPARTTVAVAALPLGACLEIDLVARL